MSLIALEHREDDNPSRGIEAADLGDGGDARHAPELQVHQSHVRSEGGEEAHGFVARGGQARHLHVGLPADQHGQPFTDDLVIVHAQHANGTGRIGCGI